MDKQQKEALMDELLVFMNEEIESSGNIINVVRFDFNDQGEDAINYMNKAGLSYEQLLPVLNTCFSRKYITQKVIGAGKYGAAQLTEEGQGRAISVEAAKHALPKQQGSNGVVIGELHAYAPAQIGNNNTQNIENVFTTIIEKIDQADASDAEKQEAKSRLRAFLEHPLTNTALGLSPAVIQALGGAG
ncbi:hypothetical protein C2E25_10475 [Geothermobacter hydrogeniphilus]|uniref:Uncharacterized protein n=1 Tax=Geothermobacter hydrogeniphilus TaxID=1969733 RepID=A0A2K2H955_9BACT|nr:hypothetical protein [Geothermobacter hydrogeniphilus]PNU19848.1 hypothetical protein C2E25_10475 [Geothermobacter hydrogeniphilus]